jgi:hypothetical protein
MDIRKCIKCDDIIPEGRLKALPNATTCISCSTASMKKGIMVTHGTGDHTYQELSVVSEEIYNKIIELEQSQKKNI